VVLALDRLEQREHVAIRLVVAIETKSNVGTVQRLHIAVRSSNRYLIHDVADGILESNLLRQLLQVNTLSLLQLCMLFIEETEPGELLLRFDSSWNSIVFPGLHDECQVVSDSELIRGHPLIFLDDWQANHQGFSVKVDIYFKTITIGVLDASKRAKALELAINHDANVLGQLLGFLHGVSSYHHGTFAAFVLDGVPHGPS